MVRIYLQRAAAKEENPRRKDYEAAKEALLARACSDLGHALVARKDLLRTKDGKPYIPGNPFYISFSDSGEVAALAVSDGPIGIDVQRLEEKTAFEKLARRFYRAEEAQEVCSGEELSGRRLVFFRLWAAKEAYLKYLGTDLSHGMDRFVTDFENGRIQEDGKAVPLVFFACPDGYVGAVCGDWTAAPESEGGFAVTEISQTVPAEGAAAPEKPGNAVVNAQGLL